jgi:diguanylate cyclase (GGDEF)-like protein
LVPANASPAGAIPAGLRIVLVEDSPADAWFAKALLACVSPGSEALAFTSVADATQALADLEADCILLDLGLPDADGLEAVQRIADVAGSTPIVVLTGRDDDRLALEAIRGGAQDYILKRELDAKTLSRAIGRAIERARLVGKLERDALHDGLTGLPDRVLFADRLAQAIARSRRSATTFSIAFIDVDDFKAINDRYGHASGDEVLQVIAARLVGALRASDTACRFGGDEFAAVCEHPADPVAAASLAARLHEAISAQPVPTSSGTLTVSISVGIAVGTGHETAGELLRRADHAMYSAKSTHVAFALFDASQSRPQAQASAIARR